MIKAHLTTVRFFVHVAGRKAFPELPVYLTWVYQLIKVPLVEEFHKYIYARLIAPITLVYFVVTNYHSVIHLHQGTSAYNYNVTAFERHSSIYAKQYTRVKVSTW